MSYFSLYDEGRQKLFSLQEGEHDARALLMWAFELDTASLLKHYTDDEDLKKPEAIELYRTALALRAAHVPLQYITQRQNFCGFEFYVDKDVLIPRQDTECLVAKVIEENPRGSAKGMRVLDMCTGSGCIAVSLKMLGAYDLVLGADISREALKIADANAMLNGADILFYESDMFSKLGAVKDMDIIVSNPPYIRSSVLKELMPEVRDFEPSGALDGGEDGLDFYRILAKESKEHLKPGGKLYLEIGYDQADAVKDLLERNGYHSVEVFKDLAQLDRIVRGIYV